MLMILFVHCGMPCFNTFLDALVFELYRLTKFPNGKALTLPLKNNRQIKVKLRKSHNASLFFRYIVKMPFGNFYRAHCNRIGGGNFKVAAKCVVGHRGNG